MTTIAYSVVNIGLRLVEVLVIVIQGFHSEGHSIDKSLLETAERIFLYLMPVFIVLGFYNYYRFTMHVVLQGRNISPANHESSVRTMDLSKTLFLSSIISFVLIKGIEELFYSSVANVTKLAAFRILLLMLMTYFLILVKRQIGSSRMKIIRVTRSMTFAAILLTFLIKNRELIERSMRTNVQSMVSGGGCDAIYLFFDWS
ncbi:MAG: hypothetical protein IPJ30_12635 [Acidobacteria bacterium]|nr:hypothetical protein [Acidobacteriota bacterium]